MSSTTGRAAQSTRNNRGVQYLARLGYAVNGLLHLLIGVIAIQVALGVGGGEADQSGALSDLAKTPGGGIILWVVFVGLAALGLWLILSAFLTSPADPKKRAAHYASELGKGVAYLAVAATTFTYARGGTANSARSSTGFSAKVLAAPGGVFLVFVIGLAIVGIGIYFIRKGATKGFTKDLQVPSGAAGRATVRLGIFGYVAKGIVLGVVGILFCVAAVTLDPAKSSGLDGGLKTLGSLPFGSVILFVVGLGLVAYALYSFVRARYARL